MQHKKWWSLGVAMLLMAVFALSGCEAKSLSGSESALVGTWKVDVSTLPTPMPPPKFSNDPVQQSNFERGFKIGQDMARNVMLDIKSDRTFSMTRGAETTGDWTFDETSKTITLNPTKMGTIDVSKLPGASAQNNQIPVVVGSDGQHLTMRRAIPQGIMSDLSFMKSS